MGKNSEPIDSLMGSKDDAYWEYAKLYEQELVSLKIEEKRELIHFNRVMQHDRGVAKISNLFADNEETLKSPSDYPESISLVGTKLLDFFRFFHRRVLKRTLLEAKKAHKVSSTINETPRNTRDNWALRREYGVAYTSPPGNPLKVLSQEIIPFSSDGGTLTFKGLSREDLDNLVFLHSHPEHSFFSAGDIRYMHENEAPCLGIDTEKGTLLMFSTKQSQIDYSPLNLDNPSATLNKIDEKFFAVELIAVQQIINTCVNNGCDIRRFIASPDTEDITIKDENRVVSIKLPNGMEITHAAMSDCLAMLTFAWAQKTGEVIYYLPHGSENLVKITSFQELFPDTTANLYTSSTDVKTLFQELSTLYKIEQPTNTK